ncbi:MAG: HdeD family acid-resistance protein [Terracidiphilus sp.]
MGHSTTGVFKEVTGMSIAWSVVMIILGILAIVLPLATGIVISALVAWLIVLSGIAILASAFAGQNAKAVIWRILIGIVYIAGGGWLAFHTQLALESLTVVLAVIFLFEGIFEMIRFFQLRVFPGSGWILFDSIVTLLLAGLIGLPWPSSSAWAIGTILGINLILSGITVLMYSLAARRAVEGPR